MNFDVDKELETLRAILIDMIADERIQDDIRAEYIDKINEKSETVMFIEAE